MASEMTTAATHTKSSAPEARRDGSAGDEVAAPDGTLSRVSSDADEDDHVREKEQKVVLTKRQKLKRHCGRFWLWYLIGVIIFLAIMLPILFKVIIPVIINNVISSQDLPINHGALRVLSANTLNITLSTSLNTPLPARIDPMTLDFYNKNTTEYSPFFKVPLPAANVDGKTEIAVINQTIRVENDTELMTWFSNFFDSPQVGLTVYGSSQIHLGALGYEAKLDNTIEMPGLNYLEGFNIIDLNFIMPPDEDGHNLKGTLNLPNAGILTLGLGNLTFNMLSGELMLGLVSVYDVDLKPGNNTMPFVGNFFFNELVPNLAEILDSQKQALSDGVIEIHASGNASTVNGEHLKYVEGVLKDKRVPVRIPVITLLADVVGGLLSSVSDNEGSLIDVFGETLGNVTLFEKLLEHWETPERAGDEANTRKKTKRGKPGTSLMWKLFKMGLSSKRG